jgi:hypothetical protein
MASVVDENNYNQRAFPRITVTCPVLYRPSSSKRWQVAKMVDFSATGIRMVCDENLPKDTVLDIQVKPGSKKTVPPLVASGVIVRCEINNEQRFEISCKITKVQRSR